MPLPIRSEEHTSELQSHDNLVCRLLLEKKKKIIHAPLRPTRAQLSPTAALCVRSSRASRAPRGAPRAGARGGWGCFASAFFFNDTATTEIYTLSLHDALPI